MGDVLFDLHGGEQQPVRLRDSSGEWRYILQDRPRERKLTVFCPEAANTDKMGGTYGVWGGGSLDADYVMQIDYGSYGLNRWVYSRKKNQDDEG